jgi:hypothetical protein
LTLSSVREMRCASLPATRQTEMGRRVMKFFLREKKIIFRREPIS